MADNSGRLHGWNCCRIKGADADEQSRAYPEITAAFEPAKACGVFQLEAEIRALGFKPGEGKRKPERPVEYRGPKRRGLVRGRRNGVLATPPSTGREDIEKYRSSGGLPGDRYAGKWPNKAPCCGAGRHDGRKAVDIGEVRAKRGKRRTVPADTSVGGNRAGSTGAAS